MGALEYNIIDVLEDFEHKKGFLMSTFERTISENALFLDGILNFREVIKKTDLQTLKKLGFPPKDIKEKGEKTLLMEDKYEELLESIKDIPDFPSELENKIEEILKGYLKINLELSALEADLMAKGYEFD